MPLLDSGEECVRVVCKYNLRNLEKVYTDEGSTLTFTVNGKTARRAKIPAEGDFGIFDSLEALEEPGFEPEEEQAALQRLGQPEHALWREEPAGRIRRRLGDPTGGTQKKARLEIAPLAEPAKRKKRGTNGSAKRTHRGGKATKEAGGDTSLASAARQGAKLLKNAHIHSTAAISLKEDGQHTSTGWQGKEPPKIARQEIIRLWETGEIIKYLVDFHRIHHDLGSEYPTVLLDSHFRNFIYRSYSIQWLEARGLELNKALQDLIGSMLLLPDVAAAAEKSRRGNHYANILGYYRQYSERPVLADFHAKNPDKADAFINSGIVKDIVQFVDKAVSAFFPGIAKRYRQCAKWHEDRWGEEEEFTVGPIQTPRMLLECALYWYTSYQLGYKFNHKVKSWLVIWEAGIIIEIPPWVLVLYPSALFFHFNIDIDQIDIVVTEGQEPTPNNSYSIMNGKECEGRGSIVLFNEATMMMSSETDSATLKEARAKGRSGVVDYCQKVEEGFPQFEKVVERV